MTGDHLALIARMHVGWCGDEFGAPEIDPKRPYGNSDVVYDIVEIIGLDQYIDDYGEYPPDIVAYANKIHSEMKVALQLYLLGYHDEGYYYRDGYSIHDWKRSP